MKLRVVVMKRLTKFNTDRDKSYVIHHLRKHKFVRVIADCDQFFS